jgi:glycosyltransferase involved in cell wall biosynthesis
VLVCHVYPFFPPQRLGGVEKWILSLSHFLSKSTQDMHFLLLTDRSNLSYYATSAKKSRYGSLHVYRMGPSLFSAIYYSSRIENRIIERVSLLQLFHEATGLQLVKGVDVFHLHGVWLHKEYRQYMELALMLSRTFNKPLIVSLHGDAVSTPEKENMPLFSPEVRKTLKNAKAITTYSLDVFKALNELDVGFKSYLVPNFVDTMSIRRPTERDYRLSTRVVFVSRLEREKDPATVIKAFKLVKDKIPNSTLTVVGGGSMHGKLQDLIYKLEMERSVFLVGQQGDVRRFLWDSDVFVGSPAGYLALLEAWSAGLPVVECDEGIIGQSISHMENGILYQPHDPKELAQALVELMENEQLRRRLALNGMQTVKNYDIRSVAPRIGDIYSTVLNN